MAVPYAAWGNFAYGWMQSFARLTGQLLAPCEHAALQLGTTAQGAGSLKGTLKRFVLPTRSQLIMMALLKLLQSQISSHKHLLNALLACRLRAIGIM